MPDCFDLHLSRDQWMNMSSLGLAHLGDAVFELLVRSWGCTHGTARIKDLHKQTVRFVAAPAQAEMAEKIFSLLTQEEEDVFRRARNAAPHRDRKSVV